MNTLSARDNYHKTHNEKERADLVELINSTPVKELMVVAIARLVEIGATKEQLSGARTLCLEMLNLAAPMVTPDEFKPAAFDPVPTPDGR